MRRPFGAEFDLDTKRGPDPYGSGPLTTELLSAGCAVQVH